MRLPALNNTPSIRLLILLVLLGAAIGATRRPGELTYGSTVCIPFLGPLVMLPVGDLNPLSEEVALRHEHAHARQAQQMGCLRFHLASLTAEGRLALEAPAFCAGVEVYRGWFGGANGDHQADIEQQDAVEALIRNYRLHSLGRQRIEAEVTRACHELRNTDVANSPYTAGSTLTEAAILGPHATAGGRR
jgi:hypothetical protein